ncbi:MAG: hypothetical protein NC231_08965 [Bacillus sp. (in: Bacteria)]|nr:hypothetical protein [Bacillus sp. (in: firmicutes)]MCM1425604.1 hypothetical protein [Eubacterium sp.]
MGNETIFYYVTEESVTGCKKSANIHFWQKIKLSSRVLEEDGVTLVIIMIPDLKRGWKKEKLLRLMEETAKEYPAYFETAHVLIQPGIRQMYMQADNVLPMPPVFFFLAGKILEKALLSRFLREYPESVVLLLGNALFVEEQMQKFMDMMMPYFPRMNHLTILYEKDDERWEEAVSEYTEEIYYEYGLVAQIRCGSDLPLKRHSVRIGQSTALFLDYGYPDLEPFRALKAGDIYLDVCSSEKKEALFRRKYMEISYLSPRKYLDTMVKSGYDKLVNQAICQKITPENKV